MNTNFKVYHKNAKDVKSSISHIERNHSLKINPTSPNSESANVQHPHIIIYKKAKFKKEPEVIVSKSKLTNQISSYNTRLKKYLRELDKLEDEKKINLKKKTIERTEKKIADLKEQRENTNIIRNEQQPDFIDIPFNITKADPSLFTEDEIKKLSEIAEDVTLKLFDIDKEALGNTAHLDQASIHTHITFQIPPNKVLSDLTKMTYREAQIIFNSQVREAFTHLNIDKICDKPNAKDKYLPLNEYKLKCNAEKEKKEIKDNLDNANERRVELVSLLSKSNELNTKTIQNLETNIKEKDNTIKEQKSTISTLPSANTANNLMLDNEELEESNALLTKQNKHLESIVLLKDLDIEKLEDVTDILKDTNKTLQEQNTSLIDNVSKKVDRAELDNLEDQLASKKENAIKIETLVKKELDIKSGGLWQKFKDKINEFKNKIFQLEEKVDVLESDNQQLTSTNEQLVKENHELKAASDKIKVSELENDIQKLKDVNDDLQYENDKLVQNEINYLNKDKQLSIKEKAILNAKEYQVEKPKTKTRQTQTYNSGPTLTLG